MESEAQLLRAIERVRKDVITTLGDDAVVIDFSTGTSPEVSIATTGTRPSVTGISSHPGESEAALVTRLASTVQDCLVESRRHVGQAWPACPDPSHHHPLDAPYSSPGVWVCPSSRAVVAAIGQLEHPGTVG